MLRSPPRAPPSPDVPLAPSPYVSKESDPTSSHAVILALAGEGRGRRLLDVGSADGVLARRFAEQGFDVTCVERDPVLAARATGRGCRVVEADLDRGVPTFRETYDVLVFADVIEHLHRPETVMRDLLPALAPGGMVIVSVPNVAHLWIRASLLFGRFAYADRGILDRTHLRFFTLRSFRAFLRETGLRPERVLVTPAPLPLVVPERFHGAWLRGVQRLHHLAARTWKGGLTYQFVAACRAASAA